MKKIRMLVSVNVVVLFFAVSTQAQYLWVEPKDGATAVDISGKAISFFELKKVSTVQMPQDVMFTHADMQKLFEEGKVILEHCNGFNGCADEKYRKDIVSIFPYIKFNDVTEMSELSLLSDNTLKEKTWIKEDAHWVWQTFSTVQILFLPLLLMFGLMLYNIECQSFDRPKALDVFRNSILHISLIAGAISGLKFLLVQSSIISLHHYFNGDMLELFITAFTFHVLLILLGVRMEISVKIVSTVLLAGFSLGFINMLAEKPEILIDYSLFIMISGFIFSVTQQIILYIKAKQEKNKLHLLTQEK